MKLRLLVISLVSLVTVGFSGLIMLSCKGRPVTDMIIITECAEKADNPDYISGASWRYISGARLLAVNPNNPGKSPPPTHKLRSAAIRNTNDFLDKFRWKAVQEPQTYLVVKRLPESSRNASGGSLK